LQIIPKPIEKEETKKEEGGSKVEKIEKQAKTDKVLKSVGIDQTNVRTSGRIRKKKEVFDW